MMMKKVVFRLTIREDGTLATTMKGDDDSGLCSQCRCRLFTRTSYICLTCKDVYLCEKCKMSNVHPLHNIQSLLEVKSKEDSDEELQKLKEINFTDESFQTNSTIDQLSMSNNCEEDTFSTRNHLPSCSTSFQESISYDCIETNVDRNREKKIVRHGFQNNLKNSSDSLVTGADFFRFSGAARGTNQISHQQPPNSSAVSLSQEHPSLNDPEDNEITTSNTDVKSGLLNCKVCNSILLNSYTKCCFCCNIVHFECCVVPKVDKYVCCLCMETRRFNHNNGNRNSSAKHQQLPTTAPNGFLLGDTYSNEDAQDKVLITDLALEGGCQNMLGLGDRHCGFLMRNGSVLNSVGYEDGLEVRVINTCSFDSLFSLFLSAVRRNGFYRSLVKEQFENSLFLEAIMKFLESGDTEEVYKRRATMIKTCLSENIKIAKGEITYDCETTVDEMARRVVGMAHHFFRVCDNNQCPNKHKIIRQQLLPVTINEAVDMKTIQLQLTECLQKKITKTCGEKRMINVELEDTCCEPCDGKATISPGSMAPHFLLNLGQTFSQDCFVGPPPIDRPVPVFLGDIPTLLDGGLSRQLPFRLQGCVEEVPGHYVAYLREKSDRWLIADDMKEELETTDDYHIVYPRILLYTI